MHATGTTIGKCAGMENEPSQEILALGSVSLGSHSLPYPSRLDVFKLESADGEKFTTTEGPWDQVVQLIGFAHTFVHQQGIARVQTDIRIQTRYGWVFAVSQSSLTVSINRTDKVQPMEGNVASVERILSAA